MVVQPYADPGYGMPNAMVGNLNQSPGQEVGGWLRANALQITDPNASDNPLSYVPVTDADPGLFGRVADVVSGGVDRVSQWLAEQRAKSEKKGLWTGGSIWEGGHPTVKGVADAAQQYAGAFEGGIRGQLNLQSVHPRTLRPLTQAPDYGLAGSHTFSINGPDGKPVGTVDTTWNPETGNLHVEDFQSEQGKNSLGLGAMRQIRELLLSHYPQARTLSGQRITGAVSADRASGAGPGRAATQTIRAEE